MTALQTRQAAIDTLNGQGFFRIFQLAESMGDIFEIDTSLLGVCVGPQSDFADYRMFYYDAQEEPDLLNELAISVRSPFIARLDALNSQRFTTQNEAARITCATRDIWNPGFIPRPFVVGTDVLAVFTPQIDIVGFLSEPPAVAMARPDKVFELNTVFAAVGSKIYVVVPYYGRRQATVSFSNLSQGGGAFAFTYEVRGVRLGFGETSELSPQQRNTEIDLTGGAIAVASQTDSQFITRASTSGPFDLIYIIIDGIETLDDLAFGKVVVGDNEA